MTGYTDIRHNDWVARTSPKVQPYLRLMRLDRPIGTWLLLLPGWWGIALGSPGWPDLKLILLFAFGAVVMRGAGCVVNDLWDRDFDRQVERTRTRPLASGAVTVRQAFIFLAGLLAVGLLILLQLNWPAIQLGIASLALIVTYPLMKRITFWPQAFLGLTFNWGVLMGYTAVIGHLDPAAWLLYAAGFFWTLGYDTIYAHQDKTDDLKVGVKSLALRLGDKSPRYITIFYASMFALLVAAGQRAGLGWPYDWLLVAAACHAAWQVRYWRMDDPADCLRRFKSNRDLGLIIFAGLVAGRLIP